MREIKFRGINNSGKMIYGSLVYTENIQTAIHWEVGKGSFKSLDWAFVDPETVGEYTGLKDKNGKEIYEGDIVEQSKHDFAYPYTKKHVSEIIFVNGGFCAKYEEFGYEGEGLWSYDLCEVIGNIHENPELLT